MTNREKYAEQILDIVCNGSSVAVDLEKQKPVDCAEIRCRECKFEMSGIPCGSLRKQWCNEEYTEPPIDWSKVPVDTPILVRNDESGKWLRRYYSGVFMGDRVYAWKEGRDSWSAYKNPNKYATEWKYAKLAEESEQR